ncbi:phosphate ABC transporter permease PstA [Geitlerinema sp. PCC 9228]|uniref:phosphate ABC transporter permease PstA n=1 Tax=Geitlerinema sp. PCC 9228 TaxID=111611 RepID=UPI0008F9C1C1|nr:phosphate ABC transporter permease PstA [Geitlerinema sp. PCC 9228]
MTIYEQGASDKSQAAESAYKIDLSHRYLIDNVFAFFTWLAVAIAIFVLLVLLWDVFSDGFGRLNWQFLNSFPSRKPEQAGILSALVGTIWVMVTVAIITFPIGVGAGIYLEEFAGNTWFAKLVEVNINNLAGVPSIIYGLLGLQVFVRLLGTVPEQAFGVNLTGGRSILSGALTLSLLVLPIVIVATRESLRAVPDSLRQAGYALGGTRWQVVREHVFPLALPGIMTGTILALSRAIGETAPLITIGALTFVSFLPEGLRDSFTVLPIQIFNWVSRPQKEFHTNSAAGIIVLLVVLLLMNATAVLIRNKFQKKVT